MASLKPVSDARLATPSAASETSISSSATSHDPRFAEAQSVCPACFGTGLEVVAGKGARRCHCRLTEGRGKALERAGIPRCYEGCTLANFHPAAGNSSQHQALRYVHKIVEEYPAIERGLLLAGPCGVGKTHLSVAILRALIEKGSGGVFYEFGALLRELQASYNPVSETSEMSILAPVYEAEVLVLDELGAVRPTDWVLDMMRLIIGRRYNEQRLTILTTNYLDRRRAAADETLEERIGVRLRSRLYEIFSPGWTVRPFAWSSFAEEKSCVPVSATVSKLSPP